MISISHYMPNESPNAVRVTVSGIDFYFSYDTVVAYQSRGTGLVASHNVWSRTTGKHLHRICPRHEDRVDHNTFSEGLEELERRMATALRHMNEIDLIDKLEGAEHEENKY